MFQAMSIADSSELFYNVLYVLQLMDYKQKKGVLDAPQEEWATVK